MTRHELAYRFLMRAYPADHRDHYEDEMVSVLLDTGGRHGRWSLREAVAIVASGIEVRLRAEGELHHGLRLIAMGALATIAAIATVALSIAAPQTPPLSGALPAVSWLMVVGVAVFGLRSASSYRMVPAAAAMVVMIVAGSEMMGFKRSVVAAAALCLLFTSLGPRLGSRAVTCASLLGVAAGLAFAIPNQAGLNEWAPLSAGPWATNAQWQYSAYELDWLSGRLTAPMIFVGLLALKWRPRYLIAALALSLALWFPVSLTPSGYFWIVGSSARQLVVGVGAGLAVMVLCLAVVVPWRTAR